MPQTKAKNEAQDLRDYCFKQYHYAHMHGRVTELIRSALTAAEQRGFERGKADVVPSGDAEKVSGEIFDECVFDARKYDQEEATKIIQAAFDARDAAARAEGERIGFERAVDEAANVCEGKYGKYAAAPDDKGRRKFGPNVARFGAAECAIAIRALAAPSPASKPEDA